MANRYPLVVDTSDNNQIKEIPNGDNLLLTGNSITGVVDITASGNISAAGVVMSGTLTYQGNPLANIATTAAYSDLTGVPTNVSQFTNDANYRSNGDNVSVFTNDAGYLTTVAFNDLTGKPTTLGGYGIIDAATSIQGSLATSSLQPGANISTLNNDSGFVTLTQLTDGTVTVDVNNSGDLVGSVFADDSTMMVDSILAAVNLDGTIRGNVVPNANQHNTWDLGTDAVRFKNAYFAGTINGAHVGTLDGDVEGSVFGDDSTLLVDGNNNKIVGPVETFSLRTTNATIALGYLAGQTAQENSSVAIGNQAGNNAQAAGSVGIGYKAGNDTQGGGAIALGYQSGQTTQGGQAIAIGELAGQATQGGHGIALGYATGQTAQGAYAIAIGKQAGYANQAANSIVINATGNILNNTQADAFVVKPIRSAVGTTILMYDASSGEVTHSGSIQESFSTTNGATGVTALDCSTRNIHYLTAPVGDITANFTNLNVTAEYATNLTVIINQGATPYEVTAVQIGGAAQTIEWQGGLAPTGNANGIDSFSFTILNDGGSFVVLGQMVDFT